MKKVLLDTNIILDLALKRQKFGETAKELILILTKYKIQFFVTASSITDIYYVLSKAKGHTNTINFLKKLIEITTIANVNDVIIFNALNSNLKDFEDAVQEETAKQNNISTIITRNKNDFANSNLNIFLPEEYIHKLTNKK